MLDETNVVVRAAPLTRIVEPVTKALPVTVSVVAAEPATALVGLRLVNTGTPLLTAKLTGRGRTTAGGGVRDRDGKRAGCGLDRRRKVGT